MTEKAILIAGIAIALLLGVSALGSALKSTFGKITVSPAATCVANAKDTCRD